MKHGFDLAIDLPAQLCRIFMKDSPTSKTHDARSGPQSSLSLTLKRRHVTDFVEESQRPISFSIISTVPVLFKPHYRRISRKS
jgi:hypothetical protein